ncbi:hypothetical protein DFS34DRAFT_592418 [Phlyctochytrium arcticum]|nr:hypothetical protein DFS34DRAFT_592418 [Phlyctochytrium arcticum]
MMLLPRLTVLAAIMATFFLECQAANHTLHRRWDTEMFTGRATYYGDGYKTLQGGLDPPPLGPENGGWYGACYSTFGENPPLVPKNYNFFAALNSKQYMALGNKEVCGTCVAVTNRALGTRVVVQIVDNCPGCPEFGIDLSHQAMAILVGGKKGSLWSQTAWDPVAWAKVIAIGILASVDWTVVGCENLEPDRKYRVDGVPADRVAIVQRTNAGKTGWLIFPQAASLTRFGS